METSLLKKLKRGLLSEMNKFNRRDFIKLGLATSTILSACSKAQPALKSTEFSKPITIGYLPITDASPLLVAYQYNIFKKYGVDVRPPVRFSGWDELTAALIGNKVDVVHLLFPTAIELMFSNQIPVKVIAWNHMNGSALTVSKDIKSLKDLGGNTVAIPFWYSIHNIILQILLKKFGLKVITQGTPQKDEVLLTVMAPPDMTQALATSNIAGFIVAEPFNALAEIKSIGNILRFTGDVWQNHACCVIAALQDWIYKNPPRTQAFITALTEAQLICQNQRNSAVNLLTSPSNPLLPEPVAAVSRAFTYYHENTYINDGAIIHPSWPVNRIDFQPYPFASYTQEIANLLKTTTVIPTLKNLPDGKTIHSLLVDDSFAKRAIFSQGGPSKFRIPASFIRQEIISP